MSHHWNRWNVSPINNCYLLLCIFRSLYLGIVCFSALAYILTPAIPPVLNIIKPLNESRSHEFIYPAHYFVDEQRYYYAITMHMVIGVLILITVYIASDLCLIYIIHHGCALLTISGWVYIRTCVFFICFFLIKEMRDRHRQSKEIHIGICRLALIFQHGDTRTKRDRDREQFLGFCKIGAKLHCLNF